MMMRRLGAAVIAAAVSGCALFLISSDPASSQPAAKAASEDTNREQLIKALPELDVAKDALARGETDKALAAYGRAIATYPRFAQAYNLRAKLQLTRKNYDAAVADFTKVIELAAPLTPEEKAAGKTGTMNNSDSAAAQNLAASYYNRGIASYNKSRYEPAIADFNRALDLFPAFVTIYSARASAHLSLNDFKRAAADYTRSLESEPETEHADIWRGRSLAYVQLKDYKSAIADLDRVLAANPKDSDMRNNRAFALDTLGEYARAAVDHETLLAEKPDDKNRFGQLRRALMNGAEEEAFSARLVRLSDPACEPLCPEWIAVHGTIKDGSAKVFKTALDGLGKRRLPVFVDSPGGAMQDGFEIGRMIRASGLDVVVSRTQTIDCKPDDSACKQRTVGGRVLGRPQSAGTICASACSFIIGAGQKRYIGGPSIKMGVHQGWNAKSNSPATDPAYIASYDFFRDMGIDKSIMTLVIKASFQSMHWMSATELKSTKMQTDARSGVDLIKENGIERYPLGP